jgi:hypothetical protein
LNENTRPVKDRTEKVIPAPTETVEKYDGRVQNTCTGEMIHLTGTQRTKILEYTTLWYYYLDYEIYLENVTGVGETTGLVYTGGGEIIATSETALRISRAVHSKQHYDVTYTSSDGLHFVSFKQDAEYRTNPKGYVLVDYNNIKDTCK